MINKFPDAAVEADYTQSERVIRRVTTRALLVISMICFLGFFTVTPIFSSNESFAVFNLMTIATAGGFALAYYVIGTPLYPKWRWLDCTVFLLATLACASALFTLKKAGLANDSTLLIVATMIFAGDIFVASIGFVANMKYFFVCISSQCALYVVFVRAIDTDGAMKLYALVFIGLFLVVSSFSNWELDRRARKIYEGKKLLEAEQEKTEALLYNVLPQAVAERLRAGAVVADSFSDISVIFVDIVGFSQLAKELTARHLVQQLNRFFSIADECADRLGIEKVKTIGDAYLAVAGGTASSGQGARDAVTFGVELIARMKEVSRESKLDIKIRIGIHSGPVVGGVVGSSRLAYDYWGDTMNTASRIEGAAAPDGIAVSTTTYNQCVGAFEFGPPEIVNLKGVGATQIYRLAGLAEIREV